MTRDVGSDTQEIFGEMQEDLARQKADFRRNRNPQNSDSSGKLLVLWGFIGIILILLIVLLFRGGDKALTEELNALKTRMEQMEKKASAVDAAAKRIDAVEGQIKGLQQSLAKSDTAQRLLADRVEKMAKQGEKPSSPQAAQKKPSAQVKVHEVQPGETLFGIARKYNISADQLLKLNHMTKKDTLRTGQKLVVAP